MTIKVYGPHDVAALLDMPGCIEAVRAAMARFSADGREQPLRQIMTLEPGAMFALMPGSLVAPEGFGAKIISVFPDPDRPARSKHRGCVLLFDRQTGEPLCLADAGEITERRTAAASAVATDALARPDARRLAIFGAGAQARSHLDAIPLVRQLDEIVIWSRSEASAAALIEAAAPEVRVPMRFVADARDAAQADIICTVTSSPEPIVLGEWIAPGTHLNIVGSSFAGPVEVDSALVAKSRYFADSRKSVLAAGAEFLVAKAAGFVDDSHIVGEIGDVLGGAVPGRTALEDITCYKSLGHIVQDLAAAAYVDARARAA
jgi:ornithine cyclodeaminase